MSHVEVVEGGVRLRVPEPETERGPARREGGVFFNPAMGLARDVSVLALDALHQPGWRVLDGLAASGARGLRMAHSVPDVDVTLNDWNAEAAERIRENAELNGLTERVEVARRNLGALLWEQRYHWVDVDPFGSPSEFVDAACRCLRRGGVLAMAATDTAALNGVYPKACRRRYLAHTMRGEFSHEVALRILAGFAARTAAKHDAGAEPVLAHASDHYYRLYLRVQPGAGRGNRALDQLGYAHFCPQCGERGLTPRRGDDTCACGGKLRWAGPLWTGALLDADLVEDVADALPRHDLAKPRQVGKLVAAWREEAGAPPLYFDLHEAASRARSAAPPMDALLEALRERGHEATRTHISPLGVRTDASAAELEKLLVELAQGSQ